MKKTMMYLALGAVVVSMGSCSKKLGEFKSDFFNTTPNPLETVGENVPATISGNIPAKFMNKSAKVTATPVLVWATGADTFGEASAQPVVFQGEKVRSNGQVVSYDNGGTVTIPFNVQYQPEMAESNLYLDFAVDQNGKLYSLPRVKVGEGVIATSTLASPASVKPAEAKSNFERIIQEKYSAEIRFLINQANIRASQTSAADYVDLNKELIAANDAPNREIAGIMIHSYASPDGTLAFNTELAEERENNTTRYMENQLKKDKITEFGELTSSFTPEDWEGFQQLVERSNIQDKDLILSVLKMYKDPEQREQEIRNLAGVFNELADQILPQLRYSKIVATINVIGKSDQELIQLFDTDPQKLTEDEILYVASLTNDNTRKMQIYQKAAELYPNDYRNFNNLGMTQYVAGQYDKARENFTKAARMAPSSKEVEMNQGLLSMLDGNYAKAQEQLGAAAGLPEAEQAMGVYYLAQGDVQKAAASLSKGATNNSALAQILSKDYAAAQNTISSITTPDATTYYLAAVIGARTNNPDMVMSNLRKAAQLDNTILEKAARDMEFASYNLKNL